MEQRQEQQRDVVGLQAHVGDVDLRTPDRVGVGPQHGLGARRRARGELDSEVGHRIGDPVGGRWGRVGEQFGERDVGDAGGHVAGFTGIVVGDGQQLDVGSAVGDQLRMAGRGDGRRDPGVLGVVRHVAGDGAGVGRHGDGAKMRAGEPGEHELRGVVQMDHHPVAVADAAGVETSGECHHIGVELCVRPRPGRCGERLPDQELLVGKRVGLPTQQPRQVPAFDHQSFGLVDRSRQARVGVHRPRLAPREPIDHIAGSRTAGEVRAMQWQALGQRHRFRRAECVCQALRPMCLLRRFEGDS